MANTQEKHGETNALLHRLSHTSLLEIDNRTKNISSSNDLILQEALRQQRAQNSKRSTESESQGDLKKMENTNVNKQQACNASEGNFLLTQKKAAWLTLGESDLTHQSFEFVQKESLLVHESVLSDKDSENHQNSNYAVNRKIVSMPPTKQIHSPSTPLLPNITRQVKFAKTGRSYSNIALSSQTHEDISLSEELKRLGFHEQYDNNTDDYLEKQILKDNQHSDESSELCAPSRHRNEFKSFKRGELNELSLEPSRQHVYPSTAKDSVLEFSDQPQTNDLVTLNDHRIRKDGITIYKPQHDFGIDSTMYNNLPRVFTSSIDSVLYQPQPDALYDDSVFPTGHALNSSEDLRLAMKQAMKQNSCSSNRMKANITVADYRSRVGLQTKFRHVMSTMNRQSYDQWKDEISARAGQEQILSEFQKSRSLRNPPFKSFVPSGCPKCLQLNMSNIYGKPCPCKRLRRRSAVRYNPISNFGHGLAVRQHNRNEQLDLVNDISNGGLPDSIQLQFLGLSPASSNIKMNTAADISTTTLHTDLVSKLEDDSEV